MFIRDRYLYQSELHCKDIVIFLENHANSSGGGIQALNSFIRLSLRGSLLFMRNCAKEGGAIYLTRNSKITVLSYGEPEYIWSLRIRLINNTASYGGGIFVDDETNSVSCVVSNRSMSSGDECFLQASSLSGVGVRFLVLLLNLNKATKAGADLYGGLLDRCRPSPWNNERKAVSHLLRISNLKSLSSVSSRPVRVCFCKHNKPDCDYNPGPIPVRRGRDFTLQLVALDQVNNTLKATINAYSSDTSGIGQGQYYQTTYEFCTNLTYRIYSKYSSETLTLYADGPCKDAEFSSCSVDVHFLPCDCPTGFMASPSSPSNCICICHKRLRPYLTSCNSSSHLLLRESEAWMSTVRMNESDQSGMAWGYLVYPHCPLDYCISSSTPVYINLSSADGADAQCAFSRAGVLCGACKPTLSLALGSSRCLQCSNKWLALLIPICLMGLILVVSILILNLTVSSGTIISVVFFSNIVISNRAILIPLNKYNFLAMFVSWLSLDLGIETCFANGLDAYTKIWLQFLFPTYIFTLIAMIIIFSQYSQKFSDLLGGHNPIATLATLIWFSNAKFFRTVLSALSFTVLNYPNGTRALLWLQDGNVHYLRGKHIPLFVLSLVILFAAIVYVLVLLSWQWLLCLPKCKIMSWTRNTKLISLMDAHHAPFKDKHRYWPGLLLLISMVQYFISAFNVTRNPDINLFAMIVLVTTLTVYKSAVSGVYKKWPLDCLEVTIQFNLILFASATKYIMDTGGKQAMLANISLSIVFITFILIIGYHILALIFRGNLVKMLNWMKLRSDRSDILISDDLRDAESLQLFEQDQFGDSVQSKTNYVGVTNEPPVSTITY